MDSTSHTSVSVFLLRSKGSNSGGSSFPYQDTFIKPRFSMDIILAAMFCHDWYGHVRAQTSIAKSNDRNKQIKATWTEADVIW